MADNGFRQEDFDLVAGQTKYKLDRVAPGANASNTVVVRPKKFGYFNFTAAEVGKKHGFNLLKTIIILESAHNNRKCYQVTYSASESVGTVVSFFFEINIHFTLSRMSLRTFTPNEESSFFCHQLKYSSNPPRLSCTSLTTGWSLL